jgi:preprotein translocase subunit Sss1
MEIIRPERAEYLKGDKDQPAKVVKPREEAKSTPVSDEVLSKVVAVIVAVIIGIGLLFLGPIGFLLEIALIAGVIRVLFGKN